MDLRIQKNRTPDFKLGKGVQIHTRTYIENFASYKTAADADRPKTLLAQARNYRPGIVAGTFDKLVEHVVLLCAHLSRSTAGDVAELPQSADACGQSMLSSMQFRAAEPFRNVRRFASSDVRPQPLANFDLLDEYPFVPPLLLATLVSSYSFEVLKEILSTERVRNLDIWQDFAIETDQLGGHDDPDQEQVLCDQYARRFANICASIADVTLKSEDYRLQELRQEGKFSARLLVMEIV